VPRAHVGRQAVRRLLAGLMAYLVALQLLAPGFALAQIAAAAPDHSVICASDTGASGEQSQHPVDDHSTCMCVACGLADGGIALGPTPSCHAIVWQGTATAYRFAPFGDFVRDTRTVASGPHNPRAPPAA
jgi:hypothetical protein